MDFDLYELLETSNGFEPEIDFDECLEESIIEINDEEGLDVFVNEDICEEVEPDINSDIDKTDEAGNNVLGAPLQSPKRRCIFCKGTGAGVGSFACVHCGGLGYK